MLVEYDRFIEDQFLSLTAFHEANGLAPLDREEYDEYGDRGWGFRWAQGSPRRACLIDAGHGDEFRDHQVWERLTGMLTDEDEYSLRWTLPRISTADARLDLDEAKMDFASVGDPGFPWRNCGYLQ